MADLSVWAWGQGMAWADYNWQACRARSRYADRRQLGPGPGFVPLHPAIGSTWVASAICDTVSAPKHQQEERSNVQTRRSPMYQARAIQAIAIDLLAWRAEAHEPPPGLIFTASGLSRRRGAPVDHARQA